MTPGQTIKEKNRRKRLNDFAQKRHPPFTRKNRSQTKRSLTQNCQSVWRKKKMKGNCKKKRGRAAKGGKCAKLI